MTQYTQTWYPPPSNPPPPILSVFLTGDEDLAQKFIREAMHLWAGQGEGRFHLTDSVTVDIVRATRSVTIHAEFQPQYVMFIPVTTSNNLGVDTYRNYFIGAIHRKDGMLPCGLQNVYDFSGSGQLGYDTSFRYGSEGVGLLAYALTGYGLVAGLPHSGHISMSLIGVNEDLNTNEGASSNLGNAFGVAGQTQTFPVMWCIPYSFYNEPIFSPTIFGLRRDAPRAAICASGGCMYNGALSSFSWSNPVPPYDIGTVYYYPVTSAVLMAYFAEDTGDSGSYVHSLTYDIMISNTGANTTDQRDLNEWAAAKVPVIIPLGNFSSLVVCRSFVADASYWFGGYWVMSAWHLSTDEMLLSSASATSIASTYFPNESSIIGFGPTSAKPRIEWRKNENVWKYRTFMRELMKTSQTPVPLGDGTTLVFSKNAIHDLPNSTPPAYTEQYVCMAATSAGITARGVLESYYGSWAENNSWDQNSYPYLRWTYGFIGAVHAGGSNVIVFIRKDSWDASTDPDTYTFEGIFRYVSTDAGATWASSEVTFPIAATETYFITSAPKLVQVGEDVDTAKLVAGVVPTADAAGTATIYDVRLMYSDDGGLTWTDSPLQTGTMEFELGGAMEPTSPACGLGSVHIVGSPEEGFAPSPYASSPAFYGAAGPACRDWAADPNL